MAAARYPVEGLLDQGRRYMDVVVSSDLKGTQAAGMTAEVVFVEVDVVMVGMTMVGAVLGSGPAAGMSQMPDEAAIADMERPVAVGPELVDTGEGPGRSQLIFLG